MEREVYRFGEYGLDTGRRELRCRDREVALEPRVYELLLFLVRNRDRAVDKDELQDAVWPRMIVTETALTRAIMKARKAVGDDASRQAVIKTLHGHGYRFIAPLEAEPGPSPAAAAGFHPAAEPPAGAADAGTRTAGAGPMDGRSASRRRAWVLAGIGTAAALVVAVLAWRLIAPVPAAPEGLRLAVLPVVDTTGNPELAWTGLGLMSYASNLIALDEDLPTVPDASVVSLVDAFGWSGDLAATESRNLVDRLRHAHGASHVLAMRLGQESGRLRMSYALLQPDGRLREGTMVGEEGTALARGVVQAVYGLVLRRSRLDAGVELVSADPFHNEAFGRGMGLRLQGRCAEAVPFFRLIVEQEPALVAPRHELAACLRTLGEWQEAESLLTALVAELEPRGASRPLAQSLMVLGILYNRTGRLDDAENAHQRALAAAQSLEDYDLAGRILLNLAIVSEDRADFAAAAELLDRAVAAYQRAGLEILPGQVWAAYANLELDRRRLVEADAYFRRALDAFRTVGDRANEAMMLNNLGLTRRLQGRLDEAEQFHLLSREIREAIGDRVGVGRIHGMLATVHAERGQYAAAREAALQAVAIAAEARDRLFEGTSLAQLGDIDKALGDAGEAGRHYREARAVFEAIGDRMRVLQADLRLARLDLESGRAAEAEAAAQAVLRVAREADFVQPEVEALELQGDIAVEQGDLAAARPHFEAALERLRESSWEGAENAIVTRLAGLLMDQGELSSAEPLIGTLARQQPNAPALRAQARYAWLRGDAASAARLMAQARERAGANWDEVSEQEYQRYLAAQ